MEWAELVERLRNGDAAAGPMLISQLTGRLDRYAETYAPDLSQYERECAVEAALVKVVRKIDHYTEEKGSLPTWARAFVRNEINERRRGTREIATDPQLLTGPADTNDPEAEVDAWAIALTAIILQLDPADTALIELRVIDLLTFAAIAERLGPPATEAGMRKRFQRAKQWVYDAARNDPDLRHFFD